MYCFMIICINSGGFLSGMKGNSKALQTVAFNQNYVACFACEPSSGTPADSKFVEDFLQMLEDYKQSNRGLLLFPKCLKNVKRYYN